MPRTPGQRNARSSVRLRKQALALSKERAANQAGKSVGPDPYWLGLTQEAIMRGLDGISLDLRACFKDASNASALDGVSLGARASSARRGAYPPPPPAPG